MSAEVDTNKQNIVAFIHTYQPDGNFDPYMSSVICAFKRLGLHVHVVRTNDLFPNLGSSSPETKRSINKLVDFINNVDPAFIFSTNRGGITQEIMKQTFCPIITRMVDLVPFYHQGGAEKPLFCERDHVFVPTLETVDAFEIKFPAIAGKVYYLPFATDPDEYAALKYVKVDVPISFVGTYFYCDQVIKMLSELRGDPGKRKVFLRLMRDIERDFHVHFDTLDYADNITELCLDFEIEAEALRMQVSNVFALNKRIHYLDSVSDLGLKLYGTSNWIHVSSYSLKLLDCFQFDEKIDSRDKLLKVYQGSKIALNIPHHQAGAGMPYRVYDIMASKAMLITEYHEDSELFDIFGKDVPIPMYRDAAELRNLIEYYLNNEEERQIIVKRCNELIYEKEATFADRAKAYCAAVNLNVDSFEQNSGKLLYVKLGRQGWYSTESTESTESIESIESIESKRGIRDRVIGLISWVLPYQLYLQWALAEKSLEHSSAPVDLKRLRKLRSVLKKLGQIAKWILPYKLWVILQQLKRAL
ncbi:MAG: glycosyltransferase [Mariprofundaceae bacterium]|nr:glycosyltransferase [Mariprofundaceae bacterium]